MRIFKRKSEDEILTAAIRDGIAAARAEEAKAQAKHEKEQARKKGDLQKAYNAASGILTGLKALSSLSNGQFTFEEKPSEQEGILRIETNIPAKTGSQVPQKVTISVEANKRISIKGDEEVRFQTSFGPMFKTQHFSSSRRSAPKKALAFIAKEARKKGLVP